MFYDHEIVFLTMGRKYAIGDQEKFHFVTFTVVHWIDVFIRDEYKNIFIDSLKYCQKEKGLEIGAWCIMTNHIHLIVGRSGNNNIEDIIRDLKIYTSRHIRKAIEYNPLESRREWMLWIMKRAGTKKANNKDFQFWQQHNHPIELNTNEMMDQRVDYIHNNPVMAGFVQEPGDWLYSSARDYEGRNGMLELVYLE